MAQKITTQFVDDLDGTTPATTVPFMLDGAEYEIDLSDTNADRMREVLSPFVENARYTGGRRARGPRRVKNPNTTTRGTKKITWYDRSAVREWANANGFEVADVGRISNVVIREYERANPHTGTTQRTARRTATSKPGAEASTGTPAGAGKRAEVEQAAFLEPGSDPAPAAGKRGPSTSSVRKQSTQAGRARATGKTTGKTTGKSSAGKARRRG